MVATYEQNWDPVERKDTLGACLGIYGCVVFVAKYLAENSLAEELSVLDSCSYNWVDMKQILPVGKNTRGTGVEDRTLEALFKVKLKEQAKT